MIVAGVVEAWASIDRCCFETVTEKLVFFAVLLLMLQSSDAFLEVVPSLYWFWDRIVGVTCRQTASCMQCNISLSDS